MAEAGFPEQIFQDIHEILGKHIEMHNMGTAERGDKGFVRRHQDV